jgi:proteic killer suppression protein
MIRSFKNKETEKVFRAEYSSRLPQDIQRVAYRRLLSLDSAEELIDLNAVPGNRLEKLIGDRAGQYSIRINDRWRVCFHWNEGVADSVEIVDYH